MLDRVVIARPAGNDTALVFDAVPEERYREINAYIQAKDRTIEQVMFVRTEQRPVAGRMAGGEFCGNATRALGFCLLKGGDGSIELNISGAESTLVVAVKDRLVRTGMPVRASLDSVRPLENDLSLVTLQGISHLVVGTESSLLDIFKHCSSADDRKALAGNLLKNLDLLKEPASGAMFLARDAGGFSLTPYVHVRDIDTFYAETACGSGSIAVGLVEAKRRGRSVRNLAIKQPSGMIISVDVELSGNAFKAASINGPVEILWDGPF